MVCYTAFGFYLEGRFKHEDSFLVLADFFVLTSTKLPSQLNHEVPDRAEVSESRTQTIASQVKILFRQLYFDRVVNPMAKSSEIARKAILEVVSNQIRDGNPPETRETFDRLVSDGLEEDEARLLIGRIVASEIFDILKHHQPYNQERYVKALRQLPKLPE